MVDTTLKGKIALVTGAAERLGKALALALADQGAQVIIHYNQSPTPAFKLAQEIQKKGVKAWTLQADFNDKNSGETLIARALKMSKRLDILVNNASIFPSNTLADVTFEDLERTILVNAWAPLALGRAFAASVKKGQIINLLDARIQAYDKKHLAYHLSKKMLATVTEISALEFAPRITVNAVAPGLILPPQGQGVAYLKKLRSTNPLNAYGTVRDITDAIIFLLKSPFITGQTIFVDGGRHILGVRMGPLKVGT